MIKRILLENIMDSLKRFPVVGILGPRQVGKTTLAKQIIKQIKRSIYLDLELTSDLSKLRDAQLYLEDYLDELVIIDEIQRMPELFPLLRALVDKKRKPSRFIILGSANPNIIKGASESLTGRVIYKELTPFNLTEVINKYSMNTHWMRGGFPGSLLSNNNKYAFEWMGSFISAYAERDLPMLGLQTVNSILKRFWIMLSHSQGSIWNASNFARALGISVPTVNKYLDYLEAAFLITRLNPYYVNIRKRLVKSPKVYVRDSGVLHSLAGLERFKELKNNVLIGASWEGYVIEQISQIKHNDVSLYYYRTKDGAECDLVFTKANKAAASLEIKYSLSPKLTKSLQISIKDLKTLTNFIIIPREEDYMIRKDIRICGLMKFLTKYLPQL